MDVARELRNRWMEQVNDSLQALPAPKGRYEVSRTMEPAGAGAETGCAWGGGGGGA